MEGLLNLQPGPTRGDWYSKGHRLIKALRQIEEVQQSWLVLSSIGFCWNVCDHKTEAIVIVLHLKKVMYVPFMLNIVQA